MDEYTSLVQLIAITLGVSWASGINLYAAMLTLGLLGATGQAALPPGLEILTHPLVIGAAGLMYCVEFFADKVPGVDTAWDALHSFIRIPAGAVLAAAAAMEIGPAAQVAAAIIGGGLAAGSHVTKAGSRALINTVPEPFTNWGASLGEDAVVIGSMWAAIAHPTVFLCILGILVLLMIWLIPKLWRGIRKLWQAIKRMFNRQQASSPGPSPPSWPDTPAKSQDRRRRGQKTG
jgi:hypothetical protein